MLFTIILISQSIVTTLRPISVMVHCLILPADFIGWVLDNNCAILIDDGHYV